MASGRNPTRRLGLDRLSRTSLPLRSAIGGLPHPLRRGHTRRRLRERYRSTGLVIPADHRTHHVVRLVSARKLRVLDLRTEKNLDVLQVDDQISTGQHPDVWAACHRLVDAARRWWTDIDAIVYRSRTTPESSLNYAFFGDDAFDVEFWPLGERIDVLTALVLHQGFTVNWDFDVD